MHFSVTTESAALLSVHVQQFSTPLARLRWRRDAELRLAQTPGQVFVKPMGFLGSGGGFRLGSPALRSQVVFTGWQDADSFYRARGLPDGEGSPAPSSIDWALCEIVATRGSHFGRRPLSVAGMTEAGDVFASLTLGRATGRRLPRFFLEGARVGRYTRDAPGMILAVSAGWPTTGNCTFSLWESERDMVAFAYRHVEGHIKTVERKPPVLCEQLNARMRLIDAGGHSARAIGMPDRSERLAAARNASAAGWSNSRAGRWFPPTHSG